MKIVWCVTTESTPQNLRSRLNTLQDAGCEIRFVMPSNDRLNEYTIVYTIRERDGGEQRDGSLD